MPLVRRWMLPIVLLVILLVAGGAVWLSRHPEEPPADPGGWTRKFRPL